MMRQNDDKCLFDEAAFERFNGFGWFRPQFVHVMAPITLSNYYDEGDDDEDDGDESIFHFLCVPQNIARIANAVQVTIWL